MPIKTLVVWLVFSLFTCTLVGQSAVAFVEKFQNTPLEQAFETLAKKYNLKFSYENLTVANVRVTQKINAKDLSSALNQLLAGLQLEFHITGTGQILVRKALSEPEYSVSEVKLKKPRKISGSLIDAWTQQPLAYGHILCGQGEGVISDEYGRFELTLDDASVPTEVAVQYLGYQTRKSWIEPGSEPLELKIRLTPKVEQLQGMTVTAKLPALATRLMEDAIVFNPKNLMRLPAFVNGADLMRSLQYLPGVSAHDDLSADLNIRGGSGDENLIILDGITLYNVTHYFGIFSIINPHIVDEVKVYKNAFPAEYGGRTSSVVDIRSATPATGNTKVQAIADVNLLTSSAVLDVPIGKQIRVMAAGRITNQNLASSKLFNLLGAETKDDRIFEMKPGMSISREVVSQKPELRFYDTNLKASWRPSTRFSADFNFFNGEDNYAYAYKRETTQVINTRREILNESYDEEANWYNRGLGLQLNQKWNPNFTSNVNFAFSEYEISRDFSQISVFQFGNRLRPKFSFFNQHDNYISGMDLNWKNEWRLNSSQKLVFGLENVWNKSTLNLKDERNTSLSLDDHGLQQSLYAESQSDLLDSTLNVNIGLRGTRFSGTTYLSPRVGLFVNLSKDFHLKSSWSIYQQFLYQFFHEDRYGRSYPYWVLAKGDPRFPVTTAHNLMLGANYHKRSFEFDLEFYTKNTNNLVEHARTIVALPDSLEIGFTTFKGKGKTVGMDLLLKQSFKHFDSWIAYTLSKSSQSFPNIARGQWFPGPNDRRHQLKWVNQFNLKKFDFSLAYVFASGRPYTDLSKLGENPSSREILNPETRLSYLDDYHRVDFGTSYSFHIGKANVQANLSFFNLLNHPNVKYRQYIYSYVPADPRNGQMVPQNTVQGLELQSLDFTTSVGLVVRF